MVDYQERFYRSKINTPDWVSFTIQVKESDLWVRARKDLSLEGYERVFQYRHSLDVYIQQHPEFKKSLEPLALDSLAPPIVQTMVQAGQAAGVGPMASVAGAIALLVGQDLLAYSPDVIIENGGDLFIVCREPLIIGIYAGKSALSGRLGIQLPPSDRPVGLCTSSGTVGHSLSFGRADAVTVLSPSAALSDAVATAVGNRVRTKNDIQTALDWAQKIPEVEGVLIIIGEQMGVWGEIELVTI
ncbi:MAG: UPF0280 family protein [Deltaproteobacteria bacterium]|nr:UPF0280 family protein [Deltaproteobacteria bacterium]